MDTAFAGTHFVRDPGLGNAALDGIGRSRLRSRLWDENRISRGLNIPSALHRYR